MNRRFLWAGALALAITVCLVPDASARRGPAPFSLNGAGRAPASVATENIDPGSTVQQLIEFADLREQEEGTPHQFAEPVSVLITPDTHGTWDTLADGGRLWRLRISAPGATDLNLGFEHFELPVGATLHVWSETQDYWEGPYTSLDNAPHGQLWLPVVPGSRSMVELYIPPAVKFEPVLVLTHVGYGFRDFLSLDNPMRRQGSCNNDVVCSEGDPWRDDIASVGVYQLNGSWTCTGTMVTNTNNDFTPYFLTANHCGISSGNAATMVVYWNFEAPNCGDLCCGSLTDNQTGAIFRASYSPSDFCLVELSNDPDPASNVYFAGWDRSGASPPSCTAIHHPGTDEKAISFNSDALTVTTYLQNPVPGDGTHLRIDDWEDGTTEPGSSGSGIWDPAHRLVGQLHGGFASCSSITSDWYGRVSVSWNGGGSSASRLSTWLDPGGTGALTTDGSFPSGVGNVRYDSHAGADACDGSPGASNGIWEPGETVEVAVTVRAVADHTKILGTLSTSTPGVTIVDGTASWPNLTSGNTSPSTAPHFTIQLDEGFPCFTSIDFDLSLSSAQGGPWMWAFSHDVGQAAVPGGLPVAIPDNSPAGVTHTFSVGESLVLTDVNVQVDISHTYVGDLKIEIESPMGTRITLLDRPGVPASTFGCSDNDLSVLFNETAGTNLEAHCAGTTPWFSGPAKSTGSLSAFNGQSTAGDWKLIVSDNAGADTGQLLSWELRTTPPLSGQCNVCDSVTDTPIAARVLNGFGFSASRPNPFRSSTEIRFSLEKAGPTRLEIFDVSGRLLTTLVSEALSAGAHTATWNGRDSRDRQAASGIYFYRLTSGGSTDFQRAQLVR